jgi:WD40 repeat protein
VKIWDLQTFQEVCALEGTEEDTELRGVEFSPCGQRLATVDSFGTLKIWNAPSLSELPGYNVVP